MLFNSTVFLAFFVTVYALYLVLQRRLRAQNALLLLASYIFYGYWDLRFLGLLLLTTAFDFCLGRWIERAAEPRRRRTLLALSICANLSILGLFKYFNFFAASMAQLLHALHLPASYATLSIVLPVGISFYTFQSMGYTIDVYRRSVPAVTRLLDYALFVAFFPQLVAGPIERAANRLPQITALRRITAAHVDSGLFLILWGYFKKVVIADNMAKIADAVFNNTASYHGLDLILGALAFTIQIYGDFSGYTDIGRGVARLMGFELMLNFRLPYFAASPAEFWERWHISLSTWLRDYLYIPLGGNRHGPGRTRRNLMLTMLLGGLWHGAAWNFVIWGGYHGSLLVIHRLLGSRRTGRRDAAPVHPAPALAALRTGQVLLMFALTVLGWVLFRSRSVAQIVHFLSQSGWAASPATAGFAFDVVLFTLPLALVQLGQHLTRDLLCVARAPALVRVPAYACLLAGIFIFGVRQSVEFIYFQF